MTAALPAGGTILLAKAHYPVTTLGPGVRAGIWTQGCTLHCPGCLSRDTWEADSGKAVEVEAVLAWLRSLTGPLDGVTISGGEPFQQPAALMTLLRGIHGWRQDRSDDVDILVYSGYVFSRLSRVRQLREPLALCDAVVTGPYVDRLNPEGGGGRHSAAGSLVWRGSANQRITPLTELGRRRYGVEAGEHERDPGAGSEGAGRMQVSMDDGPEGRRVYYIGIPRRGDMAQLSSMLEQAGIHAGEVSWRP